MTMTYPAPAPDLFPSALATAIYRAWPRAAYEFVSSFGYYYWQKMRHAWRDPKTERPLREMTNQLLQQLGRLLETDAALFVTFADTTTAALVPYPLTDHSPSSLNPMMEQATRTAMAEGRPQCRPVEDGTWVAIPCYAYGTLNRPDLLAVKEPGKIVIVETLMRSVDCMGDHPADDPTQPPEPACPELLGVMLARRPRGAAPLSLLAWQRALYCAAYTAQVLAAFATEDRLPPVLSRPVTLRPATAPASWTGMVGQYFTRATVAEQLQRLRSASPSTWQQFLRRAHSQLGFEHPRCLHPKRLYEQLTKYDNAAALVAMTEATRQTATSLSMTAISAEWVATLRNVMGGVTQVIPDAPTVLFAASKEDGSFRIEHTLDATLSPEQEAALAMIALWTAVQGAAIHDVPTDDRLLFQHLRRVVETTAPIVAIPVYNWRATEYKEWPDLHGVFLAIRHADAPPPSPAMWCAWTLAAQYLLSPLAAAVDGKKAPYTPTDVEQSLDTACRRPFDPDSAKRQYMFDDLREMNEKFMNEQLLRYFPV